MSPRTPTFLLTADDKPLSDVIVKRVMTITVTDNRTGEADQLDIVLNDHDGALELPKRGVVLHCSLGWTDTGLVDMGKFIVDETEWSGTPDQISIKATSADFRSPLKAGKSQSYHRQTLGEIASIIAKRNSLTLSISSALAAIGLNHVDQTDESDINLLTRLAKMNGAEVSIKQKRLLIFKAGSAQTASGHKLKTIHITRNDGDQFRYTEADRDSDYTGVSAHYHNGKSAKRLRVTAGNPEVRGGGDDPTTKTKVLKGTFADEASARRAAAAENDRIKRRKATFTLTTAEGWPEVSTESPVKLQGFKTSIDALPWIVNKATHSFSESGLTTQFDFESSM